MQKGHINSSKFRAFFTLSRYLVNMGTREASHAGSWYEDDPDQLSSQLDEFLGRVPETLDGSNLPIPKARVIIAPYVRFPPLGSPALRFSSCS